MRQLPGVDDPTDADLLRRTPSDVEAFTAFYRRWERPLLVALERSNR